MNELDWSDIDFGKGPTYMADSIGSFIINFAFFNSCLDGVVSAMLRLNIEQSKVLVVPMQPREKVSIIRSYSKKFFNEETHKEVNSLCKDCSSLIDYRNALAHSHMISTKKENTIELYDYGGAKRFSPKVTKLTTEDVGHNAIFTLKLGKEMQKLGKLLAD